MLALPSFLLNVANEPRQICLLNLLSQLIQDASNELNSDELVNTLVAMVGSDTSRKGVCVLTSRIAVPKIIQSSRGCLANPSCYR